MSVTKDAALEAQSGGILLPPPVLRSARRNGSITKPATEVVAINLP